MTSTSPSPDLDQPAVGQRRPRARKGEGALLREEIMEAAERLLLETGSTDAVSIRAVADAVGVTPPSIYRHFSDKDTLIAEVCAQHFNSLEAEMDAAVAQVDDPIERLKACGKAYIRFGVANPEHYRVLFMTRLAGIGEERQKGWLSESSIFSKVVDRAQACIDAGRLRPEHADAYQVAVSLWAQVHGLTSLAVSKPFLGLATTEEALEAYANTCIYGFTR